MSASGRRDAPNLIKHKVMYLRKILHLTAGLLLSASSSLAAGTDALDALDKAELLKRLATLAPATTKGAVELTARARMCNYFKHVFNDGRSFDDKVLDLHSSQDYTRYMECCTTTGFPQVGVLSGVLAGEDPLPTLPEFRRRQIKQTETILHGLIQDQDFAPLMNDISDQIRQTSKEIDRVACAPLAATYELIQSNSAR
jgi:hypothetical protein